MEHIPVWGVLLGTIIGVFASIEAGYQLGSFAHRRSPEERESPVSTMVGAVLGLTAFILAFTFGMVANRFEDRKELVR